MPQTGGRSAAPLSSVLPAFIEAKSETKKPELKERDKELLDLRQQVDMIRRDLRLGRLRGQERERGLEPSIEPEEARALIRQYLARGIPSADIVRRLRPLGPPEGWIERQIARLQSDERDPDVPPAVDPSKEPSGA